MQNAWQQLRDDLAAEQADLDAILADVPDDDWDRPTPAEGWAIRHQVAHLGAGEQLAAHALHDPDRLRAQMDELLADLEATQVMLDGQADAAPAELLERWRIERQSVLEGLATISARARVPWITGDMGAMSFATARLMETFAHGLDITDALGIAPVNRARLRHVADLGIRTRPFSYSVNGMSPPDVPILVRLHGPGGPWQWGPEDAADRVTGSVLSFAQVVCRRRHPDDTDLVVTGDAATEWIAIAQAYAGPPAAQRPAGLGLPVPVQG